MRISQRDLSLLIMVGIAALVLMWYYRKPLIAKLSYTANPSARYNGQNNPGIGSTA